VKLSRRRDESEPVAEVLDESDLAATPATGKGRPTPKRRDVVGPRGPVTAPKTRKEAYARQKANAKATRRTSSSSGGASARQMTVAERRAAMRAGDPSVLPRRDQGKTRKLARDYVDSHRMASNYLLLLLPLLLVSYLLPILEFVVIALFIGFLVEWYFVGRRINAMSMERFGETQGGPMGIGFYAGSRAYLPRRFRLPQPQVSLGDEI